MRSGCVCVYATNRTHMNWQHAPCSNISCRRGTHIARTTLRMIDLLSCWQSNFRLSFSPDSCALILGIWYTIHGNRHVAFGVGIWCVHDVLWPSKCDNNNYIYHVLWAANKGQKYTGHHNCFPNIVLLFLYLSLMCLLCHSLSCFSRIGPMAMHSDYGPVSLLSDGPCENLAFAIRTSERLNRYWIGLLGIFRPDHMHVHLHYSIDSTCLTQCQFLMLGNSQVVRSKDFFVFCTFSEYCFWSKDLIPYQFIAECVLHWFTSRIFAFWQCVVQTMHFIFDRMQLRYVRIQMWIYEYP